MISVQIIKIKDLEENVKCPQKKNQSKPKPNKKK